MGRQNLKPQTGFHNYEENYRHEDRKYVREGETDEGRKRHIDFDAGSGFCGKRRSGDFGLSGIKGSRGAV